MPTALVLSPHLDDAVFSCGGTMAQWVDAGWHVVMMTAFTRSLPDPQGFALACQLDKGLPADVDYMALRRAEDVAAAAILGVEARFCNLEEAPHRGYDDAASLFGPVREDDDAWYVLSSMIGTLVSQLHPAIVLGPQGLGDHVDHRQMICALLQAAPKVPLAFYRDTPYAIRRPDALRNVTLPALDETLVPIAAGLDRKVAASCAYASQVGFQFGGAVAAGEALRAFAVREGGGTAAERFMGCVSQD